jgi:AhpD family alkylhydroperoxidase
MATNVKAIHKEVADMFGQVPNWMRELPESALNGFWSSMRDLELAETALPNKTKELIGIAVSGATRCRYCTLFHTEAARLFGATDAEIAEAAAMAGFTMNASTFLNAVQTDYSEFRKETLDMIAYVRQHQSPAKTGKQPQAAAH